MLPPIMEDENEMQEKMEAEMAAGVMQSLIWIITYILVLHSLYTYLWFSLPQVDTTRCW